MSQAGHLPEFGQMLRALAQRSMPDRIGKYLLYQDIGELFSHVSIHPAKLFANDLDVAAPRAPVLRRVSRV